MAKKPKLEADPGAVVMVAPEGSTTACVEGCVYTVADGAVAVAPEHVLSLLRCGFVLPE